MTTRISRRAVLGALAAGAVALPAILRPTAGHTRPPVHARALEPSSSRFPALDLEIPGTTRRSTPKLDFRSRFRAAGDGERDDGPAFRALAEAVNRGQIPAGTVVNIPAGVYRIVGNERIVFTRPVVLSGAGTAETKLRLEYTAQGSGFLGATGQGMYVMHSTGLYAGREGGNRHPTAPYSPVLRGPTRGESAIAVAQPEQFSPGAEVYLLCDDYGAEVEYRPNNRRREHFLLKQHLRVAQVNGSEIVVDTTLRHDFLGAEPRLYRWEPLVRFGLEHLTIVDRNRIPDSDRSTTFRTVVFDGVVDGWIWDVHFLNSTSIPLSVTRSRRVVASELLFDGARHQGAGGNGYLPELNYSDDSLVEYCTVDGGRHALMCDWSCWGNVIRYNRVVGDVNVETHGEYNVENLYLRNEVPNGPIEIGAGGADVHAHDGPFNELRENFGRWLRVSNVRDRHNRLIGNWHVEPIDDAGSGTVQEGNQQVDRGWAGFPFAALSGHDHSSTAETAIPDIG